MSGNYTAYHVHTELSLLDSATKFEDYIAKAVELGQTAIAFTEHGNIYQWVAKKMACDKAGLKYLHGCEVYLTEKLLLTDPRTGEQNTPTFSSIFAMKLGLLPSAMFALARLIWHGKTT